MRKIGLVSTAVIAMAAMAGAVAASAPPVIQSRPPIDGERLFRMGVQPEQVDALQNHILVAVGEAERTGLSGEAAQESIKRYLQVQIELGIPGAFRLVSVPPYPGMEGHTIGMRSLPELSPAQASIALDAARRILVDNSQLRSGSDGDLAVSALLAEREAASRAERNRPGINRGGGLTGQGGVRPGTRPSCYMRGLPDGCDAPRNVPENAATGQPATDGATTGIPQSPAIDDPDLDNEAGEPD
jgi:hypothetical protein